MASWSRKKVSICNSVSLIRREPLRKNDRVSPPKEVGRAVCMLIREDKGLLIIWRKMLNLTSS